MNRIKEVLEGIYSNPELRKSIIPLFIGNPGLSKTVQIEEFAREKGVKLVTLITSQLSPMEVSGLIMPNRDTRTIEYYDSESLLSLRDGDILFLDEILNGSPIVLAAMLTLLASRTMISGKPLPDVTIIAAANLKE
jgi:MoxR-like ATPase